MVHHISFPFFYNCLFLWRYQFSLYSFAYFSITHESLTPQFGIEWLHSSQLGQTCQVIGNSIPPAPEDTSLLDVPFVWAGFLHVSSVLGIAFASSLFPRLPLFSPLWSMAANSLMVLPLRGVLMSPPP